MMGSLYSYKLEHDHGFAPNPYHGFLTLATCKPGIRRTKNVGDWVAGWTACKEFNVRRGEEKLIYLMRVSEKMTIAEYFLDPRFKNKIPNIKSKNFEDRLGDNIYELILGGDPDAITSWKQHVNCCHNKDNFSTDIGGKSVLIAEEFYYFGEKPLVVQGACRPNVPYGTTNNGVETKEQEQRTAFIKHVKAGYAKLGGMPLPHHWDVIKDKSCNSTCSPSKPKVRKARGCKPTC